MGPDEPKGRMPPREVAGQERSARKDAEGEGIPYEGWRSIEEREDEGYSQPESSAQKGLARPGR